MQQMYDNPEGLELHKERMAQMNRVLFEQRDEDMRQDWVKKREEKARKKQGSE